MQGIGCVPIDKAKAYDYLLRAANKGEPRAQFNLARLLEKGDGRAADPIQAKYWYTQAANQTIDIKTALKAKEKVDKFNLSLSERIGQKN